MKLHKIEFTNDAGTMIEAYRDYEHMPFRIIASGMLKELTQAELAEAVSIYEKFERT